MRPKEPTSIEDAIFLIAKYEGEIEELEGKRHARPADSPVKPKEWNATFQGHIRVRKAEIIRLRAWLQVARRKELPDRRAARNKELRQALEDAYAILVRLSGVAQLSHRERDVMFRIKQVLDAQTADTTPRVSPKPEQMEETQ